MFDYFKLGESEQYLFLQLPLMLIKSEQFKGLSGDSKILYSLLLNRTTLSAKNNWVDDMGNIYIIYTIGQICEDLNCWEQKAVKAIKELKNIGLLKSVRRGLGKPNLLYVMNFATSLKSQKQHEKESETPIIPLNCENHNSGVVKITIPEFPKSQFRSCENHNQVILSNINTNVSNNNHSQRQTEFSEIEEEDSTTDDDIENNTDNKNNIQFGNNYTPSLALSTVKAESKIYDYDTVKQTIQNNIEYNHYAQHKRTDIELIDELIDCMLDVIFTKGDTVKINGEKKDRNMVINQYFKINASDIDHVLDQYKDQHHKITHLHNYLKTMLYTVKQEQGHFYTNAVRVDGLFS